jgi:two-component system CheB/CheR fusion protein
MSHEIRTPINGIVGMVQLLEYTELSAGQHEYLEAIRVASDNLLALVSDVLDLSKIEAGQLEQERREFSLRRSVSDVVKSQIFLAHAKGLTIRVDIPADVPDNLTGDQFRLKQILLNLVGNAIKFTERGGLSLSVSVEQRQDDTARLRFEVADTGIGIKPEAMERIFAPFSQADSSMTRRFGGSGLGLTICKGLTAIMGGEIRAESREGAGSTFHVRIPFAVHDGPTEHKLSETEERPPAWEERCLHILLAENHGASRMFFAEALRRYGHRVDLALNGAEALEKWSQADYDLILMDIQMPVMDGSETVGRIRRAERESNGHVPIIALTAHAMQGDLPYFLEQGFDGYVAKPTKIRDLFREMQKCLQGET